MDWGLQKARFFPLSMAGLEHVLVSLILEVLTKG